MNPPFISNKNPNKKETVSKQIRISSTHYLFANDLPKQADEE